MELSLSSSRKRRQISTCSDKICWIYFITTKATQKYIHINRSCRSLGSNQSSRQRCSVCCWSHCKGTWTQYFRNYSLSQISIRCSRRLERQKAAGAKQIESLEGPFLLYWDSKRLPDIDKYKPKVDHIAILLTGNGQEKLLRIPKIGQGTGKALALVLNY